MDAKEALIRLGGVAPAAAIRRLASARSLARAIESGTVVRDGRGRYSLRTMDDALHAANALSGTVSHLSAALFWGWELKSAVPLPQITVPRKRRVTPERRSAVRLHWADLTPDQISPPGVTSRPRTITDCLTTCPFDEALAVADSSLRHGAFTPEGLRALATSLRGPGSGAARRAATLADARAANPFESVLRALAIDARLDVEPQEQIGEFRPISSMSDDAWFSRLTHTRGTAADLL
ncbi:MAG: hypothetical protein ACJ716_07710 [Marmoricola sp.]